MISLRVLLLPLTGPWSRVLALIIFVRSRAIVTTGERTVTTAESQVGDRSSRDCERDHARTPRVNAEIKQRPLRMMSDVVVPKDEDMSE